MSKKNPNPKLGQQGNSIFHKPATEERQKLVAPVAKQTEEAPKEKQGRGRPIEHKEGWSKVTVVLLDKQIHWLDQLASNIRLNTKVALSRAELIRAAISAIEESDIDLSNIGSERMLISKSLS